MRKEQQPDYAAELRKAYDQWDYYNEHGGCDPTYADGYNMNHLRRHIQFHRKQIEENLNLFGYPEIYYREVPPEVDPNYMARSDEIRVAARASLEAYRAYPNYQFIIDHRDEIPEKMQSKLSIGAVLGYVIGLEHAITKGNLVDMRRHERPDGYLDSFASCARRMQDFMSGGMDSADIHPNDEPDDEDVEEGFGEDFDEEPEQKFGGMTMTMQ